MAVERTIDEKGVLLSLTVDPSDVGRVIGRRGVTAQAIRVLLRALGTKQDARFNLKIVNTDENGDEIHDESVKEKKEDKNEVVEDDDFAEESEDVEEVEEEDEKEEEEKEEEKSELAEKTRAELADLDDLDI